MRPYFMCKPRHCRQEMQSGYKKKPCSYFLYVKGVFETNFKYAVTRSSWSKYSRMQQTCFSVYNVVYASQFDIEFNDSSFHSEYYIRTAMSLFQTTLKWP